MTEEYPNLAPRPLEGYCSARVDLRNDLLQYSSVTCVLMKSRNEPLLRFNRTNLSF